MKNKFIVFEGLDGSGSSTQANLLVTALNSNKISAVLTEEPSTGPIGALIRQFFQRRVSFGGNKNEFDQMMAFLFAADRVDHLYNSSNGVIKTMDSRHVISTRYYYSSLAYHAESIDEMHEIYNINEKFRKPDLVFYLDIDPSESMLRIKDRHTKDEYENFEKLSIVSRNYKYIFTEIEKNAIILKANMKIEELHNIIYEKTLEII